MPKICSVEGCDRRATTRGLCPMRAYRLKAHGDVGGPEPLGNRGMPRPNRKPGHSTHERQKSRRERLDELARSLGYGSWSKLETAVLRGELVISKAAPAE